MSGTAHGWLLRLTACGEVPEPACAPAVISAATEILGPAPVGWGIETALAMAREIIERVPEHDSGEASFETLRRSVEATVLLALRGMLNGRQGSPAMVAPEAVAGNAELARRAVPLDRVLRGVRIGHAHLHGRLMEALDAEPEAVRTPEAHRVSELLFAYADLQASRLAEEYIAERDRWQRSTEAARRRTVEDILAGHPVDPAAAVRTLGYDLAARYHAGFLVTARTLDTPVEELRLFAAELARTTRGHGVLTVPGGPSQLWAWTCWPARPPAGTVAALRDRIPAPRLLHVAFGPPSYGIEGFRRSHYGAREADRVSRLGGTSGWLCDYADVGAAALLTADPQHARWFADEILAGLAADDDRVRELRETLRAYLAEGRSPQGAAERLYVARNTVTYRVKRAEELLGRPLGSDALEIRLALEIARVLGL